METAQLARAFVILVALLRDAGVLELDADDPGTLALSLELRAYVQQLTEKTRAQEGTPMHTTPRGKAALTREPKPAAAKAAKKGKG